MARSAGENCNRLCLYDRLLVVDYCPTREYCVDFECVLNILSNFLARQKLCLNVQFCDFCMTRFEFPELGCGLTRGLQDNNLTIFSRVDRQITGVE